MDVEKLKKLLLSTSYADVLIGASQLAKMSPRAIKDLVLDMNNGEKYLRKDDNECTYSIANNIQYTREDIYTAYGRYYIAIMDEVTYIDSKKRALKRIKEGESKLAN